MGAVGNVLDGLLGLREGEKKPAAVDGEASSAPVVAAGDVDPSAVVPVADSAPQITSLVDAQLPQPVPQSEGAGVSSSGAGEEVIFQQ